MTRLICILLTLLFSLSGPALGRCSDFGCWSNAAKTPLTTPVSAFERTHGLGGNASTRKVPGLMDDMRANGWQGKPIDVFEKFRSEFPDGTALEYVEYCYRILETAVLGPAPIVKWDGVILRESSDSKRFPDMRAWNEVNTNDFLPPFDVATTNHLTPEAGYTAGGLDAWMKQYFSETPHPDHSLFEFSSDNLPPCAQPEEYWDGEGDDNAAKFASFVSTHSEWAIPAGQYDQFYTQWAITHILLVKGTVRLDPDSQSASAGSAGFQELPETAAVTAPPTGFGVEYIRGSDKGGGVGGMLYSKRWVNGAWTAGYALEDARGDVTTKTDANGAVTWQATYEAFGMRTAEAGTNSDRQRANTKDEDPTGLLNEGFRYRDLEAGVFISRDPLGFVDGPNVYTYVVQNPWTSFDPEGLSKVRVSMDELKSSLKKTEGELETLERSGRPSASGPRRTREQYGWDETKQKLLNKIGFLSKSIHVREEFEKLYGDDAYGNLTGNPNNLTESPTSFAMKRGISEDDAHRLMAPIQGTIGEQSKILNYIEPVAKCYVEAGMIFLVAADRVVTLAQTGEKAALRVLTQKVAAKTPLALPAPRQVAANWGVNTYKHGGEMYAIEHIMYRHASNSGFANVSRFAEGTGARQIQGFVDDALRYGKQTGTGTFEYNIGRAIGTNQGGGAANGIRVHIRDGNIQTAFPITIP